MVSVTPDATAQVLAENQFNDPPTPGNQFFIARVSATFTGTGSRRFDGSFRLRAVGSSAVSYSTFNDYCGVIPDKLPDPEVFTGGTIEGNVCWQIRSADATSLVMFDDPFLGDDTKRVYFSLVTPSPLPPLPPPPPPPPTPSPCPTAGTCRGNPITRGATALLQEGWQAHVVSVTPDATAQVLAENRFNDPPTPGNQFFIARVSATFTGTGSRRFDGSFRLRAVGSSAVSYSTFNDYCGVIPDKLPDPEVFTGGTIEGNVCWQIRSADATSLVMFDDPFLGDDSKRVYFSLVR